MTTSISDTPLLTKEEAQEIANKAIELRKAIPARHTDICKAKMKREQDEAEQPECGCGRIEAINAFADHIERNGEKLCHFILESTKA